MGQGGKKACRCVHRHFFHFSRMKRYKRRESGRQPKVLMLHLSAHNYKFRATTGDYKSEEIIL